ncbi:MAG: GTPase HflX [Ruminococcaceae bacterium]|nr:GTPase HflX [Oscillospiraceae bacterium]
MEELTIQQKQKAILVGVDAGEFDAESSMDELAELAATAGAEVVARMIQKRGEYDSATLIGSGKLEELKQFVGEDEDILLIFDHELGPVQLRNIGDETGLAVIDRTMLILDIFAGRAVTAEGRLQVELAQLKYRLPRLVGAGKSLSRLGGGIGTRGPGESKLESDRRHIRRRINMLEDKLEELEKRRTMLRARRKKDGQLTAAIVGYTNAGKSTLLNALTGAEVMAEDMLFATLDPTSRGIELPDGRSLILIDTVGFIRRLPHHLVEAFKSTLEEAASADLILNVCDASNPELEEHISVSEKLLEELGAAETPRITVLNKCDRVGELPYLDGHTIIPISARTGEGFERLMEGITKALSSTHSRMMVKLPYDQAGLLALVRREGKVFSEEYEADGILADILVDIKVVRKLMDYRVTNEK